MRFLDSRYRCLASTGDTDDDCCLDRADGFAADLEDGGSGGGRSLLAAQERVVAAILLLAVVYTWFIYGCCWRQIDLRMKCWLLIVAKGWSKTKRKCVGGDCCNLFGCCLTEKRNRVGPGASFSLTQSMDDAVDAED